MSDDNIVKTDLGFAENMNLDALVRTAASQMFENDNNLATLEVTLNGTDAPEPPRLEFKLQLMSINGVPVEGENTNGC